MVVKDLVSFVDAKATSAEGLLVCEAQSTVYEMFALEVQVAAI
jgi:hypothetical protein